MKSIELLERLGQTSKAEMRNSFDDCIRTMVRTMIVQTMATEVAELCGTHYHPNKTDAFERGGSAPGSYYYDKEREEILRPRVREKQADGTHKEVHLISYEAAKDDGALREAVIEAMVCGVSSRDQKRVTGSHRGVSKSNVSRLWQEQGSSYITALRERELEKDGYVALMLDGIHYSDELTVVIALGITTDGRKQMLDFEIGSSESATVCENLTDRLEDRGFRPAGKRLLAILDGGAALRKGLLKHWPDASIQTCLVHVCRRIKARISKKYVGDLERLFNKFRKAGTLEAAKEIMEELEQFVAKHSAEGLKTLHFAKEEMLTIHSLGIPDTLYKSLLSTNAIENSINNMRKVLKRIKRWRGETEMASKWTACAMLEAEKGFNRINGYKDIPALINVLS